MLLDTKQGIYTVDMVIGPDTTIAVPWTNSELNAMRDQVVRERIMNLPEPHSAFGPLPKTPEGQVIRTHTSPSFTTTLEIEMDGSIRRFEWNTNSGEGAPPKDPEEWHRLNGFVNLLRTMVGKRGTPQPRGLYQ